MATKFITKRPHNKYIRPIRNSSVKHLITFDTNDEIVVEEALPEENTITDMDTTKCNKIESVLAATKKPGLKQNVKVEKKDKGLYERTTMESTTLLTEDGRALLND